MSFADIVITASGTDSVITHAGTGSVLLEDVDASSLTVDDFVFV
jgi:UDP-N-acetylglucosamine transferase subunit ALG13